MTYLTQDEIASNAHMQHRVAQCYAQEMDGSPGQMVDADRWTYDHRRQWAASPGWDASWEYAKNTHEPVPDEPPYDPGDNEACITDGQILAQVQSML